MQSILKLVTVSEMQMIEREANASGLTYEMMMEHAGKGLAEEISSSFGELKAGGVLGLVGSGNNGGDTLVALAHLAHAGWRASAYLVRPRPADDPLMTRLLEAGGQINTIEVDPSYTQLTQLIRDHSVLLDGVLGTGFQLPLRGKVADALAKTNQVLNTLSKRPSIVAVDCPSGVDCESGETAVESIPADLTVTMAAVKTGLLQFPANNFIGELRVVGIGLVDGDERQKIWRSIRRGVADAAQVSKILPPRPRDAHKGTFGTALVIAGSINYTGAALLAGKAAYRVGAGLVTLAVPEPLHATLAGHFPEATWLILPHELGVIAPSAAEVILENLERPTAMLLGPGFGLEEETREFIARFIGTASQSRKTGIGFVSTAGKETLKGISKLPPLVIDADGLKLLARLPGWEASIPTPAILTPHPGEMAILSGLSVSEIQSNRLEVAERYAREWGHVLVLKGANTVVADPDGRTSVIPVASPALARAGTGDVLAGLIVGLRAQGVVAYEAAVAGAWIHAQCGLRAAQSVGSSASVLAGDLLNEIAGVIESKER